jgi:hypothetical protein
MMQAAQPISPLPYTPAPFPGELLSSWLKRIAAEYRISLTHLAQHLGLSTSRSELIDLSLAEADIRRIAAATHSSHADIRRMMHRPRQRAVKALISSQAPIQFCSACRALHASRTTEPVAVKAWFEFWQIECSQCQIPFTPIAKPDLRRCNPAREHPEWFSQILPIARIGGRRLADFARRPLRVVLPPTAVLNLLSMRLRTDTYPAVHGAGSAPSRWDNYHCLAELFVPGLRERLSEDPLVPGTWTARKPVRLVTARTILFAAMAEFFADATIGFKRVTESATATMMVVVDRWFNGLPPQSRELLRKRH